MINSNFYFRDKCRICNSSSLFKVLNLSPTPPGNDFLTEEELGRKEQIYPLDLYFCKNCSHVQLGHVVNPEILYQKNYTYVSATSNQFVNHLREYSASMIDKFKLKKNSLVVDIGSNDGTCLSFFQMREMRVLGVDPAQDISINANHSGIKTINDFFSHKLALEILEDYGPAKFITSHNACAHIDNLFDVIKGVECLLDDEGVFVLEVGYFVDVFQNTWFDTIYHEHLDFHTVAPFEKLFDRVGMNVFDVERVSPQGGSIRLMTQKKCGNFQRKSSVDELIVLENELGLNNIETFYEFEKKINKVKESLKKIIYSLKDRGKTIAGFGAPTKATTLMAHFDLDETVLDFIVDDNPLKQGLFSPITHIPILPTSALYDRKPDYVLILAWNFSESIMRMHNKYSKEVGQFILPMPTPKIFDPKL